ncbi:MAG: S8 family serine peptidase [Planctomycetes bacterium]|nr:S8 family serine peptidase [Planctomycetota bacterium]
MKLKIILLPINVLFLISLLVYLSGRTTSPEDDELKPDKTIKTTLNSQQKKASPTVKSGQILATKHKNNPSNNPAIANNPQSSSTQAQLSTIKALLSEQDTDNIFQNDKIVLEDLLIEKNTSSDSNIATRRKIVQADYKYPFILIEESYEIKTKTDMTAKFLQRKSMVADHIMIDNNKGISSAEFENQLKSAGWEIRKRMGKSNVYLIKTKGDLSLDGVKNALASLSEEHTNTEIEPDYIQYAIGEPNDTRFEDLWGMNNTGQNSNKTGADIEALGAWEVTTGSKNIIVGVVDSGIAHNHPDLRRNMWVNQGEIPDNNIDDDDNGYIDDIHGYDFCNDDGDPMDDKGHGTHCAGTIGAVGNNSKGVVGVCWKVSLMGLKFLGSNGYGSTSDAIGCINYAKDMGANITSNSWGSRGYSSILKSTIAKAGNKGILCIAAAGNNGTNNDSDPFYPCGYNLDCIISVAASDYNDNLASFSNFGEQQVDVAAPGVRILSTVLNGKYQYYSGTSMAAPHVAGLMALFQSHYPEMSMNRCKLHLMRSVDQMSSYAGKCVSGGRINARRMMINDITAPNPNPITWNKRPQALDASSITMRAAKVTDEFPVQYYFQNLNFPDKSHDSGWIDSRSFTDKNLQADTTYEYRVRSRDMSLNYNRGSWSLIRSAKTERKRQIICEIGTAAFNQPNSESWYLVNLENQFNNPIVITTVQSYSGGHPLTIRVRNVTQQSFEMQLDEWDYLNGVHSLETVSYCVMEAGRHVLEDGRVIQAGSSVVSEAKSVSYPLPFQEQPLVFSQVSSANDTRGALSRNFNITPSGFSLLLQGQESIQDHGEEEIHWMAWEKAYGISNDLEQLAFDGGHLTHDWKTVLFTQSLSQSPSVFTAMQSINEIDTAGLRINEISNDSLTFKIEEEISLDREISHIQEATGILCLENGNFSKYVLANEIPVAYNESSTVYPGTTISITLTGEDMEGGSLSYHLIEEEWNGSVNLSGTTLTYTPNDYFLGLDKISFKVNDGQNDSNIAEVLVNVIEHPTNAQPTTSNSEIEVYRNRAINITLTANDADEDDLSYNIITHPSQGQISGTFPNILYKPNPFYVGNDIIEWMAFDGTQRSSLATVSISVNEVDQATTLGETGFHRLQQNDRNQSHTLNLSREYVEPIVIMNITSSQDNDPVNARLLSTTANTIQIQLQEWEYQDGVHGEEVITYLILESGTHLLTDGLALQAGKASVLNNEYLAYNEAFTSTPVLLTQPIGPIGSQALSIRVSEKDPSKARLNLHGQESNALYPSANIHWVTIQEGTGISEESRYESTNLGRYYSSDWNEVQFTNVYNDTPVIFANLQSNHGSNTSVLRIDNLSKDGFSTKVQEEQSKDEETNHIRESVVVFIFQDGIIHGSQGLME